MTTVVAAIDCGPAARSVVNTAVRIARLFDASVEAIHIGAATAEMPTWLARRAGIGLQVVDGPVEHAILRMLEPPSVVVGVLGSRSIGGVDRPLGHVAAGVLQRSRTPIVVVPPSIRFAPDQPIDRLLVPLEGSPHAALAIADGLCPLIANRADIVILHVFNDDTTPRMLDRPHRDLDLWGQDFVARARLSATSIELRAGPVPERIREVCAELGVDLIVLSWSQRLTADRAAVVTDVLAHASIPIMLIPVDPGRTMSAAERGD